MTTLKGSPHPTAATTTSELILERLDEQTAYLALIAYRLGLVAILLAIPSVAMLLLFLFRR